MIARVACLLLVFAAAPALAQEAEGVISIPGGGRREPPPPAGPPPPQVFISPAGEPFRAAPDAPYPVAAWFGRADTDRDGQLTQAEFIADALAFFDQLDVDKDQLIDGFENARYERDVAPEITGISPAPGMNAKWALFTAQPREGERGAAPSATPPRKPGGPPPPRRQGASQYALLNEPHPVRGADADLDQRVSRVEAEAAARRRLKLLDQDGDGRLVLADLPKTAAQAALAPPPATGRRKKAMK